MSTLFMTIFQKQNNTSQKRRGGGGGGGGGGVLSKVHTILSHKQDEDKKWQKRLYAILLHIVLIS
jgi:hypothetical protein